MSKAITVNDKSIVCHSFELQQSSLVPVGEPTLEDWEYCGLWLNNVDKSVQFWLGDWLNYGEYAYGEKYAQALESTQYSYGYLRQVAYVASKVAPSDRSNILGFRHHYEVAGLNPVEQRKYLLKAETENLSTKELRDEIHNKSPEDKEKVKVRCPECGHKFLIDPFDV